MIKRVNFTGKRRVPRDRIEVAVIDGHPRTFDAQIDLNGMNLPDDSAVFLEVTCAGSSLVQRFDFGTVGKLQPPEDRTLSELQGQNVFFTLKIVDRAKKWGRILGFAENVRPERSGDESAPGRIGILPIEPADLGQEVCRLQFKSEGVFLLVNRDVPGLSDEFRSNPVVFASFFPMALHAILTEALAATLDAEEDSDRWQSAWLRFGRNLHPDKLKPPQDAEFPEDREEWIEEVVKSFCEAHLLKEKCESAMRANSDGDQ